MVENITGGNMSSVNIFPTAIVFVGPSNAGTLTIRNTLTFNNQIDGNGNIYNSSGGSWTVDTLRNYRYASATTAKLDSSGTFPRYRPLANSPVITQGIKVNLLVDYFNVPYSNPPPVGYAMVSANATYHVIGTGSGTVSVTSMAGLAAGDTLALVAGTYTGATFTNLNNITILSNTSRVTFTGNVTLGSNCFSRGPEDGIGWFGDPVRPTSDP
jgi:hypothetical protein